MNKILMIMSLVTLVSCNAQVEKKENNIAQNQENMKTIIVDVRTVEEWNEGHAECSVNYPLDKVVSKAEELKQYDKVVLVCRSGGRASSAKMQLENLGVKNIENLGAWQNIKCD
jgi:phage shock protein E